MISAIPAATGARERALPGTRRGNLVLVPPAWMTAGPARPQAPEPELPEHRPPDPAPPPRPDPTDPDPGPQTPDIPVVDPPHDPAVPEPRMH